MRLVDDDDLDSFEPRTPRERLDAGNLNRLREVEPDVLRADDAEVLDAEPVERGASLVDELLAMSREEHA